MFSKAMSFQKYPMKGEVPIPLKNIESFSTQNGPWPYKTRQSRGYDPTDNSIHIAVGDVFNLGNGYRLRVGIDCVYGEGRNRHGNTSLNIAMPLKMGNFNTSFVFQI